MDLRRLFENEEISARLNTVETDEEFLSLLIENGATEEEARCFFESMKPCADGEIPEEMLELVAGGGYPYGKVLISRVTFRLKQGAWPSETYVDEKKRTITLCGGKKGVCKTYKY